MSTTVLVLTCALLAQLDRYSEPGVSNTGSTIQQSPPIAAPQPSAGPVRNTPPVSLLRTKQAFGEPLLGNGPAAATNSAAATQTPPGLNDRSPNQLPFVHPPVIGVAPLVARNSPPLGAPPVIKVKPSALMRSILQSPSAAKSFYRGIVHPATIITWIGTKLWVVLEMYVWDPRRMKITR